MSHEPNIVPPPPSPSPSPSPFLSPVHPTSSTPLLSRPSVRYLSAPPTFRPALPSPNLHFMDLPSQEVLSRIPPWRRWVVQWDISHNAVPLAFFAFTAMWQTASLHFGMTKIPPHIWYVMYYVSCTMLFISALIYITRAIIYPPAISSDFDHPRLLNFFFMPVIIGALCILTTPPALQSLLQFRVGFYVLALYQVSLSLYLFGEWLFGSRPTSFIHPLVFMQTIGFFLCASIAALSHLIEQSYAMLSVGFLFWLLVFITNFQHLSPALHKRAELPQPTFFLFIAPPAQAALAVVLISRAEEPSLDTNILLNIARPMPWPRLAESFLYIDLFLYLLMFRLFPTFWTQKFSISWWAYIFPLSAAASAAIWRFKDHNTIFWAIIAAALSIVACLAMVTVLCFMIWAIASGRTPNNPSYLRAYYSYCVGDSFSAPDEHGEP